MSTAQTSAAPAPLTVTEVSLLVGVSRSRVYQRIHGTHENAGRPMPAIIDYTNKPGTRSGRQILVAWDDAMAWRAERVEAGLPVGEVPVR
jgi:hypothetical protein